MSKRSSTLAPSSTPGARLPPIWEHLFRKMYTPRSDVSEAYQSPRGPAAPVRWCGRPCLLTRSGIWACGPTAPRYAMAFMLRSLLFSLPHQFRRIFHHI